MTHPYPAFLRALAAFTATMALLASSQPDPQPVLSVVDKLAIPDLDARLEALVPDDPEPFFLLGEEVADEADSPDGLRLARHLYIVAYEIEREQHRGRPLAPSICLALRRIERVEDARAWLSAIAGALDPRYAARDWSIPADDQPDWRTALKAAEMLGLVRAGEGLRALPLRDDPQVVALLERYGPHLGPAGLTRIDTMIRRWPCPECHNERPVRRPTDRGNQTRLCNTCLGNPGPELSPAELRAHLLLESRLLKGARRSWAAQTALDDAAPLLDPDPDALAPQLAVRYDLDPSLRYWRGGRWVAAPDQPQSQPHDAPPPVP